MKELFIESGNYAKQQASSARREVIRATDSWVTDRLGDRVNRFDGGQTFGSQAIGDTFSEVVESLTIA